jgi:Holliday junction resolvasome RuvABC endonuclease subunit
MTILVGIDIGSRLTGWCVGDGAGIPEADAFSFDKIGNPLDGWDYGGLLAQLEDQLAALLLRTNFGAVVYEAPIHIPKGQSRPYGDTLHKMRLLYPMGAFLEWWCMRRGISCHEVAIADIKHEVTGDRFADKDELVAVAAACGLKLPSGDARRDAADGWGAWLLGLRYYDPLRSQEWDARIRGQRGGLL